MDILDVLLQAGLITSGIVAYLLLRRSIPKHVNYKRAGWNYPFKLLFARYAVRKWKAQLPASTFSKEIRTDHQEGWDSIAVKTTASNGTVILLEIKELSSRQPLAETNVFIKFPDGVTYLLPQSPEPAVGPWETIPNGWGANGLKILFLEPGLRMRILYNGLLTRQGDNMMQHVTLNLIWVAATAPVEHPKDWSNQLAAQALALEPWRDTNWAQMLGKLKDGGWVQFGSMQGRFISYDDQGNIDRSEYVKTRGITARGWLRDQYQALRRAAELNVATSDGTLVHLKCMSYRDVLTEVISGSVRFPNFSVESITSTDLTMADFCERSTEIPAAYTINVSTSSRDLKVVLRIHNDGGKYYGGDPFQHETFFRSVTVNINGYSGSGLLELVYESTISKEPYPFLPHPQLLRWLSKVEAGAIDYCASFEERAARSPDHVGGKCASLALLSSVQKEEGYKVPPGFCISVKAMEKHLEQNPELKTAIKDIEAAIEDYDETNFKAKCEKASSLFAVTEISGDVKTEILASMAELREKAVAENLGPELRFAVRSSAVGEDSDVLSAAGQNETFLGCATDEDVLEGVQKCWGSMFAFTSAYYRRQNGQPCLCGGGVAVQALVAARVAGVLFTRHPAAGDRRRLLITANYGLGESVVSGAVEPDTFIIKRNNSSSIDDLQVMQTILGEKKQRVAVVGDGIDMVEVPEIERGRACLSDSEVLRLARVGVIQETLWGAPRDIEWALAGDDIFLLQARPITSLERWTEEELLHELDSPIMSDDELTTFANTGEVLPRPLSPMSHDIVISTLSRGIDRVVGKSRGNYDHSVISTHHRCGLALYNSVYRIVPKEIDINIRMLEYAVHGHKVADEHILATAIHRNKPAWYQKPYAIMQMIKGLIVSKHFMNSMIRDATALSLEGPNSPQDILDLIEATTEEQILRFTYYHGVTTSASTFTQFIAMNVLLEGRSDFDNESCNDIGTLLSSGDVLSAEVPNSLAKLARMLEASGHYEQFRAQEPKEAMKWLKQCLPQIYLEVCNFLEKHGHRAIMEFDLFAKPWILVPEEMMKVLQNLRASPEVSSKSKTDDDIIDSLKTPRKSSTRKVLRWVMPLCRRTVRYREGTKAHLILAIHKTRLAFLRLGKLLVKRWYLPHEDMVFFFRLQELKTYVQTRDPALLRKAIQRHQYYPGWCKLKFAELNNGWVVPLEAQGPLVTGGDIKIEAASVCGGEVVARACVVNDLSEIGELQQGDVLVTHATDIGWSPYFPLLSGIVTELGGLISHGAVIAREYGLPCIVGATNATDIFRTGDFVRLSGTKGTLERVQLQDDSEQKKNV